MAFSWAAAGVLLKELVGGGDMVFRKEEQGEEDISGHLWGRENDQLTCPGQAVPKVGPGGKLTGRPDPGRGGSDNWQSMRWNL